MRFKEEDGEIIRFTTIVRDPATQVMDLTFRYERQRPGSPPVSETVKMKMRYFFRYEIEHLLARSGFSNIEVFGGFDRRPYDYVSGETVVLARV